MQPNLFYLSGPHGGGKTTLEKELVTYNPRAMAPELYSRNVKFNTDPFYREMLKMGSRAIENYEYLETAKQNPDRIVIANRCVYDDSAYHLAYLNRGWLSREEYDFFEGIMGNYFREENSRPYAIVLNPPFEVVERHLRKRWENKGKKWREDDLEYARLACEAYRQYGGRPEILYLNHEIDLESKLELKKINDWMESIYYGGAAPLELKLEEKAEIIR
jgi:deoxyadenosine/deoxycytidine kinase